MVILAGQMVWILSYTGSKDDILSPCGTCLANFRLVQVTKLCHSRCQVMLTLQASLGDCCPVSAAKHLLLTVLAAGPWVQAELLGGAYL